MTVLADCPCGRTYHLKDLYAGRLVRCPFCRAEIQAELEPATPIPQADPIFERDRFLLRQKSFTIAEKYNVWNERNQPILFVERPAYVLMGCLAASLGVVVALAIIFAGFLFLAGSLHVPDGPAVSLAFLLGMSAAAVVVMGIRPRRHIRFYRDDTKQDLLYELLQDRKLEFPLATFTLRDAGGEVLALFRKNRLLNFFRRRWDCYRPDGTVIFVAKEDSVILSLLRRVGAELFAPMHFIITDEKGGRMLGEFSRKFTLFDRYVLNMERDGRRTVDRRVALALGVLLDTGEGR